MAAFFGTSSTASADTPKRILFPIVGPATYTNDFGDPRGSRSHEGNDMMAPRRSPVVAVEAGKIRIHNGSSSAGCMLYLYGKSGTTYLYIHLNNDLGKGNDNRGGCKTGVSYAPGLRDGEQVRAGELIGFVGDSGDANGVGTHLHFELHPGNGGAVSPYSWLRKATKLLFATPKDGSGRELQQRSAITLTGTVVKLVEPEPEEEPPSGEQPPTEEPATGGASGSGSGGAGSGSGGSGSGGSGSGGSGSGGSTAPPPPPPPSREAAPLVAGSLLTISIRTVLLGGSSFSVTRRVTLTIAADVSLQGATKKGAAALVKGAKVTITTSPVTLDLKAQRAAPGALVAAAIALG